MKEARISINGTPVSLGCSMTFRVALNSFAAQLEDPEWEEGPQGIRDGYEARISELLGLIHDDIYAQPYLCERCKDVGLVVQSNESQVCDECGGQAGGAG